MIKSYKIVRQNLIMSNNVQDQIILLKNKIEELEKQKMLDELKYKESNIDYNIQQLDSIINTANDRITNGYYKTINGTIVYSKKTGKYEDKKLVYTLTPIYNLLRIMNERLYKIESALNLQ